MHTPNRPNTPAQLTLNFGLGSQLLNQTIEQVAALRARMGIKQLRTPPSELAFMRQHDAVDQAAAALFFHCKLLLRTCVLTVTSNGYVTWIRVCNALEYVVDHDSCRVTVQPASTRTRLPIRRNSGSTNSATEQFDDVDLLNPLSRPAWLYYVASLPGGIVDGRRTDASILTPLWHGDLDVEQALPAICRRVFDALQSDQGMQLLRLQLRQQLIQALGTDLVDVALRSRLNPRHGFLHARHVNRVWPHLDAFRRINHENPRLLTALAAWLQWTVLSPGTRIDDAVPAMRVSLLAAGLPPKAWRIFAAHGLEALQLGAPLTPCWTGAVKTLRYLHTAKWPKLPPREFLGLLVDVAGVPETDPANERNSSPAWFWQWLCDAAHSSRADTRSYQNLVDEVPQLAWLVREFKPTPDANQRRQRLHWLRAWAEQKRKEISLDDRVMWARWLQRASWSGVTRLHVVPLLSPRAVVLESQIMRNCADGYVESCRSGDTILISLRHPTSGKHLALLELFKSDNGQTWIPGELAGPCNQAVPGWLRKEAPKIAAITNARYQSWLPKQLPLLPVCEEPSLSLSGSRLAQPAATGTNQPALRRLRHCLLLV